MEQRYSDLPLGVCVWGGGTGGRAGGKGDQGDQTPKMSSYIVQSIDAVRLLKFTSVPLSLATTPEPSLQTPSSPPPASLRHPPVMPNTAYFTTPSPGCTCQPNSTSRRLSLPSVQSFLDLSSALPWRSSAPPPALLHLRLRYRLVHPLLQHLLCRTTADCYIPSNCP
jgi:hypothetical protein